MQFDAKVVQRVIRPRRKSEQLVVGREAGSIHPLT
jgi:hypothetical protein